MATELQCCLQTHFPSVQSLLKDFAINMACKKYCILAGTVSLVNASPGLCCSSIMLDCVCKLKVDSLVFIFNCPYLLLCILGRGVNREGFNFKLATVKTCSTRPLLNKYALWKNFEVGLQTPPSPQTPYIGLTYGKGQKLKIWILFLPWSKCIHSNLEGIIITCKQ